MIGFEVETRVVAAMARVAAKNSPWEVWQMRTGFHDRSCAKTMGYEAIGIEGDGAPICCIGVACASEGSQIGLRTPRRHCDRMHG